MPSLQTAVKNAKRDRRNIMTALTKATAEHESICIMANGLATSWEKASDRPISVLWNTVDKAVTEQAVYRAMAQLEQDKISYSRRYRLEVCFHRLKREQEAVKDRIEDFATAYYRSVAEQRASLELALRDSYQTHRKSTKKIYSQARKHLEACHKAYDTIFKIYQAENKHTQETISAIDKLHTIDTRLHQAFNVDPHWTRNMRSYLHPADSARGTWLTPLRVEIEQAESLLEEARLRLEAQSRDRFSIFSLFVPSRGKGVPEVRVQRNSDEMDWEPT